MTFESLGLDAPFQRAAQQRGYLGPTPIQAAAIPPALAGRDVQGTARTGSGKTQAFGWPVLQRLADAGVPPEGSQASRARAGARAHARARGADRRVAARGRAAPARGAEDRDHLRRRVDQPADDAAARRRRHRRGDARPPARPDRPERRLDRRRADAGAGRGRPPAGPGLRRRAQAPAGAAAAQAPDAAVLGHLPARRADAGRRAAATTRSRIDVPDVAERQRRGARRRRARNIVPALDRRRHRRRAPSCCSS